MNFMFYYHLDIEETAGDKKHVPQTQIRAWIKDFEALSRVLKRFWDKDSIATLNLQRQKLGDIMDALGLNATGRDKTRSLPLDLFTNYLLY